MNIAWVFVIIVVCAYLIGSISFARIFSWAFAKIYIFFKNFSNRRQI